MRLTTLMSVAVAVTALVVGVGIATASDGSNQADVPDDPLADISLAGLTPERAIFCDRIPEQDITDAVGEGATASAWLPGQAGELESGLSDVPHEYGCQYVKGDSAARAWIFGSPVSTAQAQAFVDEAAGDDSCTPTGPIGFGTPGVVLRCTSTDGRSLRALGRIGDSWVRCELNLAPDDPATDLDERGQRWCVAAVYAMQPA